MPETLLSLSEIATLAQVRRQTVSMWRSRSAAGDHPFPAPAGGASGTELFAASEVAAWLAATGRGNNADAAADAASFGTSAGIGDRSAVEALLAVRAALDERLAEFDADELRRHARSLDPEDTFLRSEVESLGTALPSAALAVDAAVEAAWTPAVAFERAAPARSRFSLASDALSLVADIALVLAGGGAAGEFIDPSGICTDLLLAISDRAGETGDIEVVLGAESAARSARRRLAAHGIAWRMQGSTESHRGSTSGILVAQLPNEASPSTAAREVLTAAENLMLAMPAAQRGVIIAPASALSDALPPALTVLRRDLLRDGRIRAIVRLPEGLLTAHPRQALTLWVLGPATVRVPDDQRWTMVADVGERRLDAAVRGDLVGDVFATVGGYAELAAHSFAFGRVERTAAVVAGAASLTAPRSAAGTRTSRVPFEAASARAVRIEQLIGILGEPAARLAAEPIPATEEATTLAPETIGRLRSDKTLRYRSGTRVADDEIGTEGYTVIGVPELTGVVARGTRRVGILGFERTHDRALRTAPGDVVFSTTPTVAALVDHEGGSVVVAPARVLSIARRDAGLVPELVAADIRARPPGSRRWRDWSLRRVLPERVPPLERALTTLADLRTEAERRLRAVDELDGLLADGAVFGSIRHPLLSSPDPAPKGN